MRMLKEGEMPSVSEWNALVLKMKSSMSTSMGAGGSDFFVAATPRLPKVAHHHVLNQTGVDIPEFSVFGIRKPDPALDYNDPPRNEISIVGELGSHLALYTNEDIPVRDGRWGTAVPISMWDRVLLRSLPDCTPEPGQWCGVEIRTTRVTKELGGLVCLGPPTPDSPIDGDNLIPVMRAVEPQECVGVVIETITAFSTKGRGQLGKGKIRVKFRTPKSNCVDGPRLPWGDGVEYFDVVVWNYTDEVFAAHDDHRVKASHALGIGLVVEPSGFETPSTTTSTTTTPAPLVTCSGQCKWISNDGTTWTLVTDGCEDQTTTTGTTTTDPCPETTTSTTTTTTEAP